MARNKLIVISVAAISVATVLAFVLLSAIGEGYCCNRTHRKSMIVNKLTTFLFLKPREPLVAKDNYSVVAVAAISSLFGLDPPNLLAMFRSCR